MLLEMAQGFETSSWHCTPSILEEPRNSKRARCDADPMMDRGSSHFGLSGWGVYGCGWEINIVWPREQHCFFSNPKHFSELWWQEYVLSKWPWCCLLELLDWCLGLLEKWMVEWFGFLINPFRWQEMYIFVPPGFSNISMELLFVPSNISRILKHFGFELWNVMCVLTFDRRQVRLGFGSDCIRCLNCRLVWGYGFYCNWAHCHWAITDVGRKLHSLISFLPPLSFFPLLFFLNTTNTGIVLF